MQGVEIQEKMTKFLMSTLSPSEITTHQSVHIVIPFLTHKFMNVTVFLLINKMAVMSSLLSYQDSDEQLKVNLHNYCLFPIIFL